jgi:hypothetical protein
VVQVVVVTVVFIFQLVQQQAYQTLAAAVVVQHLMQEVRLVVQV